MTDQTTRAKWARHVRRQAAGLTPEQVTHKLRGVRAWQRNGVAVEDTTSYSAVGARLSVAEWARIADVLAATGAAIYDPTADPIVQHGPVDAGGARGSLSPEVLDQLSDAANRALNDYYHEGQCACVGWPAQCLSTLGRYRAGQWDTDAFAVALPLIAEQLDQAVNAELAAERDRYRTAWHSARDRVRTQRTFRTEDNEDAAQVVAGLRARLARVCAVFGQIDTGIECGICDATTARYRDDGHAMCASCMSEVEW